MSLKSIDTHHSATLIIHKLLAVMGYLRNPQGGFKRMVKESGFEIEIACERYPVEASLRAFYDPGSG